MSEQKSGEEDPFGPHRAHRLVGSDKTNTQGRTTYSHFVICHRGQKDLLCRNFLGMGGQSGPGQLGRDVQKRAL